MKSRRRTDTDGGFFAGRFMTEKRKAHRVVFEKGFTANMMAIDGTWRRPNAGCVGYRRQTFNRRLG